MSTHHDDRGPRLFSELGAVRARLVAQLSRLLGHEVAPSVRELLLCAIVLWYLAQTLALIPLWDHFWTLDGFAATTPFESVGIGNFINHPALRGYWPAWIAIFFGLGAATLVRRRGPVIPLVFYIAARNVESLCPQLTDGGSNLMRLLLLYLVVGNVLALPERFGIRVGACARNLTLLACKVQIAIVYACAGLYKVTGHLWSNGMALYYIRQSEYATDSMFSMMFAEPLISLVSCYAVVAFQLSFAFLVFSRARKAVLAFGVLFHVLIIFTLGLMCFGLAMIVSYFAFLNEDEAEHLLRSIFGLEPRELGVASRDTPRWLDVLVRTAPGVTLRSASAHARGCGGTDLLYAFNRSYVTRIFAPVWALLWYGGVFDTVARRLRRRAPGMGPPASR